VNATLLQLLEPVPNARIIRNACIAAAGCVHLVLAGFLAAPVAPELAIPATEVELEPIKEAPPPPEPPPSPPSAAEPEPPPTKMLVRRAPAPPSPARAAALLTARDDTPEAPNEAPVRFVSDPNGQGYGTEMVARGGTAEHGESGPLAPQQPLAAARPRITASDRLQRQPTLIGTDCRGYFPDHARQDQGLVSIVATVLASGAIAKLEIESETPRGEGFANAARACLGRRKFTPALDRQGSPTGARTRINLRFTR
jgi:protein TonB